MGEQSFKPRCVAVLGIVIALLLAGSNCAAGDNGSATLATVDGVGLPANALSGLHVDVGQLSPEESAASVYLLVLHEALTDRALAELGIEVELGETEAAFARRTARYDTAAERDLALKARNETAQRTRIEARLDVLRDTVSQTLVYEQAEGFDMDAAYRAFLIDNAEVCVQQMVLRSTEAHQAALERLEAGEEFDKVARELSEDSFVDREAGESGAGGDFGCSAPAALPTGLTAASLDAPIGVPQGFLQSRNGVHVMVVYDRTTPLLDEVQPEVLEHAVARQGPELFRLWALRVLASVEVEVNPDYGQWGALPETEGLPTVVPVNEVHRIVDS